MSGACLVKEKSGDAVTLSARSQMRELSIRANAAGATWSASLIKHSLETLANSPKRSNRLQSVAIMERKPSPFRR